MQCECQEPSLNEMMQEPIIRAVMARDSVKETELRSLLERVRTTYTSEATHGRRQH
jgi:hypothetical protein